MISFFVDLLKGKMSLIFHFHHISAKHTSHYLYLFSVFRKTISFRPYFSCFTFGWTLSTFNIFRIISIWLSCSCVTLIHSLVINGYVHRQTIYRILTYIIQINCLVHWAIHDFKIVILEVNALANHSGLNIFFICSRANCIAVRNHCKPYIKQIHAKDFKYHNKY